MKYQVNTKDKIITVEGSITLEQIDELKKKYPGFRIQTDQQIDNNLKVFFR